MEESRPGEYLPVYENERGTYIFNSKDLCMIDHIPELIEAGIDSFKIEGRMKTALYVAVVARTYRKAIDDYLKDEKLNRLQNVRTDSLQQASFSASRPTKHRFMTAILMSKNIRIWVLLTVRTVKVCMGLNSAISFPLGRQ